MKKCLIITVLACVITSVSYGQKTYGHGVFWARVVLADTINSKLKWEVFLQKRTQDAGTGNIFSAPHFFSIWPWLSYTLSKTTRVSLSLVGYFDSHLFYNDPSEVKDEGVKEYRISLRAENEQRSRLFNYSNRYSLEYRMRDLKYNGDYLPNWRVRYMLKFEKPLLHVFSHEKPLSVFVSDEVFIQFGEAVKNNPNVFDQNRISFGFAYEVVKNIKFSASYLNIRQSRISGKEFDNANALWMIVTFDNLFSQFKRHQGKG
ncbi:DUF2490 domain-containing protein [Mucilaginibacter pedocola]|uniref:DUF2490 domain-containing protein n=1 Tax=Mucilaginibacter pedocola TaxID=1792845 RepID=UPI0009942164|nr:DUF2490 domain-containing protein [Mucilaginibacter pedocola]